MQAGKICILLSGIENLKGNDAIDIQEYFDLERYPTQPIGTNFYYALFRNNLDPRDSEVFPRHIFTEFLVFIGLRGYAFRLDRAHIHGDKAVDYIMHLTPKVSTYMTIPQKLKDLGKR